MTEAPERIWITGTVNSGSWNVSPATVCWGPTETEYVRADRIEELEAKLDKALSIALYECPYSYGTGSYKDWWHDRRVLIEKLREGSDELG